MPVAWRTSCDEGHVAGTGAYGEAARRVGEAVVSKAQESRQAARLDENTMLGDVVTGKESLKGM